MNARRTIGLACVVLAAAAAGRPHAQQASPRWVATRVVTAGALDGPGALTAVFDLEVTPTGSILAGQTQTRSIAVFSPEGRYLRSIGRPGRGPGEFNVLGRMGWIADSLWVVDFGRVHVFGPDLEFARTITIPTLRPPRGVTMLLPGSPLRDGSILGFPINPDAVEPLPIVRITMPDGAFDTLAWLASQPQSSRIEFGGETYSITHPWHDDPLWLHTATADAIVLVDRTVAREADGATFEILRITIRGDTLVRRAINYTPVPLDNAMLDRILRPMAERYAARSGVTPASAEQRLRQHLRPPPFLPPATALVTGRDGTIWIRREDMRTDSADWHVFGPDAEPIGWIRLPARLTVHRAQRNRLWGVIPDSLDVPFVHVYEVRPAG